MFESGWKHWNNVCFLSGHVSDRRQKVPRAEGQTGEVRPRYCPVFVTAKFKTLLQTSDVKPSRRFAFREKELAKVTIKKEDVELIVSSSLSLSIILYTHKSVSVLHRMVRNVQTVEQYNHMTVNLLLYRHLLSCRGSIQGFSPIQPPQEGLMSFNGHFSAQWTLNQRSFPLTWTNTWLVSIINSRIHKQSRVYKMGHKGL